ncbi:CPBP family glutamic-type intramembrane protease [Neorhodopirellula lusitana]|uniref:CPBP family glutamic-type intramembrane protease n=1 Tax=Neorhodopirellula lusitana TaxID=445327 RepID=UPI00384B6D9D
METTAESVELGVFEWMLATISLLILCAFLSSLWKWVSLLRQGKRLFGPQALVIPRPRPRPYWSVIHAAVFYGFVIVVSVILSGIASAVGWIDLDALSEEGSPISVAQLLISSIAMLAATVSTILIALPLRPKVPVANGPSGGGSITGVLGEREGSLESNASDAGDSSMTDQSVSQQADSLHPVPHARPGFGWRLRRGDISLGVVAAWLILPPTMLMMGAVSALQEYSHPVLDALKPEDPSQGPDYAIFAALFFTTAIVTPIVEEFWFRGLLQGGLQRLADAPGDARRWLGRPVAASTTGSAFVSDDVIVAEVVETGNPYQASVVGDDFPGKGAAESLDSANVQSSDAGNTAASLGTRSDWTPTAIWPMFLASLLFALAHWGQGLAPIPLFFLSLGLGYLYRQTGSLIPSITVHFILNGFTMSATMLEMMK